jgi:tRNA-binding EMAP/Myf-like protein
MLYTALLKAQEEGLTHLFYHCCMKDGVFKETEIDNIAGKLVSIDLQKKLNFRDEMTKYKSYRNDITDETAYLKYLLGLIKPVNLHGLFSWCVELCISDGNLSNEEEQLLNLIADELKIDPAENTTIKKVMVQRKLVETDKVF